MDAIKCPDCDLIYRYPKPNIGASVTYYQENYKGGSVTDLPTPEILASRLNERFRGPGAGNDYSSRISVLEQIRSSGKVFEFGCSWGYGLWQLRNAGYDVAGFEISEKRAEFGRRQLGVSIVSDRNEKLCAFGSYDIVFSAHVLEHIPDLGSTLDFLVNLLKPDGTLVTICPNAAGRTARLRGLKWGAFLSEDHVNAITAAFLCRALVDRGLIDVRCATEPFATPWTKWPLDEREDSLNGEELLIVARRP